MRAEPNGHKQVQDRATGSASIPADVPRWITPALIDLTLKIWQPFYKKAQLTPADAVQILLSVGRLAGVLGGR